MTALPLAGLSVALEGSGPELEDAAWLLSTLGATPADDPAADRVTDRVRDPDRVTAPAAHLVLADGAAAPPSDERARAVLQRHPLTAGLTGIPDGAADYASALTLACAALAAFLAGATVTVPALDVAIQLFLPEVMAASYGAPHWPGPRQPVAAPGGGYVSCELGTPEDQESFSLLSRVLPGEVDAPALAAAAQEWRLPVCDYRRRPADPARAAPVRIDPANWSGASSCVDLGLPARTAPLAGVNVVDLTSMWAGPLCTWLLGRLGAAVLKVEPAVRPDGMRAFDGAGVHPGGRCSEPGRDSALFNSLNSGKDGADLDLRDDSGRHRLMTIVEGADVVVDAFSPRVMPNLGLTHADLVRTNPSLLTLSMPAFPPGPERAWVAYGTGVHAVSGLADVGGTFRAPAVTYPDAVGGLTGALAVLAGLVGRSRGWTPAHLEVSLLSAIRPLLSVLGDRHALGGDHRHHGTDLLAAAGVESDHFFTLDVTGRDLLHPVGPFRGPGARSHPSAPPLPPGSAA